MYVAKVTQSSVIRFSMAISVATESIPKGEIAFFCSQSLYSPRNTKHWPNPCQEGNCSTHCLLCKEDAEKIAHRMLAVFQFDVVSLFDHKVFIVL